MARRLARNTRQPGLQVEAESKLPDWAREDLVVCGKGPLHGQWFTRSQWEQRRRSQLRMRELGSSRSLGSLDYLVTHEEVPHPEYPSKTGFRAVLKPSATS
ncbi:hypothetical protein [Arthrobacter sp. B1805]|uniref:hypothetical protein n=1 Tax=Arthrobacter sp. B1805 TaxID=2058892 RepID=UPI000CE4F08B|nr:hypothetical protein [Arthrobacter sp. B1805]